MRTESRFQWSASLRGRVRAGDRHVEEAQVGRRVVDRSVDPGERDAAVAWPASAAIGEHPERERAHRELDVEALDDARRVGARRLAARPRRRAAVGVDGTRPHQRADVEVGAGRRAARRRLSCSVTAHAAKSTRSASRPRVGELRDEVVGDAQLAEQRRRAHGRASRCRRGGTPCRRARRGRRARRAPRRVRRRRRRRARDARASARSARACRTRTPLGDRPEQQRAEASEPGAEHPADLPLPDLGVGRGEHHREHERQDHRDRRGAEVARRARRGTRRRTRRRPSRRRCRDVLLGHDGARARPARTPDHEDGGVGAATRRERAAEVAEHQRRERGEGGEQRHDLVVEADEEDREQQRRHDGRPRRLAQVDASRVGDHRRTSSRVASKPHAQRARRGLPGSLGARRRVGSRRARTRAAGHGDPEGVRHRDGVRRHAPRRGRSQPGARLVDAHQRLRRGPPDRLGLRGRVARARCPGLRPRGLAAARRRDPPRQHGAHERRPVLRRPRPPRVLHARVLERARAGVRRQGGGADPRPLDDGGAPPARQRARRSSSTRTTPTARATRTARTRTTSSTAPCPSPRSCARCSRGS